MRVTLLLLFLLPGMAAFTQTNNQLLGYQAFPTIIQGHAVDSQGNQYYAGTFKGELNIKGERLTAGEGQEDLFLVKANQAGQLIYHKTFGSTNTDQMTPDALVIRENSTLSFAGRINETISFQGKTVSPYPHPSGNPLPTSCLVTTDTAGNVKWAVRTMVGITKLYATKTVIHAIGTINHLFSDIKVNDSVILKTENKLGLIHLMFDTTGQLINVKTLTASQSGQQLQLIHLAKYTDDKLLLSLRFTGAGSIIVNGNDLPVPSTYGTYSLLLNTDSSYKDQRLKVVNPNRHTTTGVSANTPPISLSAADSIYTILAVESGTPLFTIDGFSIPYAQNTLVVMDSTLTVRRVAALSPVYVTVPTTGKRKMYFKNILAINNHLYMNGYYFGANESPINTLVQRDTTVPVLPDLKVTVNINGASKSFIAKTDLGLSNSSLQWYGEHTPYEYSFVAPVYFHDAGFDKIAFALVQDNVWNPFQISTNLNIETGSMQRNADLSESTQLVEYLADGSRIVMGFARGQTALDKTDLSVRSNSMRRDVFICRIMPDGKVKWFQRIFSTLLLPDIRKLTIRDNKAYFLVNYGYSVNDSNYIRVNNEAYKTLPMGSLLARVDENGQFSVINLKDPVYSQSRLVDFNFFSTGDLAVLADGTASIRYANFPNTLGFYLMRINTESLQLTGGRMYAGNMVSGLNRLEVDKDDAFYISYSVGGSTPTTLYKIHDGTNYIGQFEVVNITSGPSQQGLIKLHWDRFSWAKRFTGEAGSVIRGSRNLFLVNNKPMLLVSSQLHDKALYWDGQLIHSNINATQPIFVQLDTAGALLGHKRLPSMNVTLIKKGANETLYLSGAIAAAQQIDTISLAYSGFTDAVGLVLDSNLVAKKSYRLHTPYLETMFDFAIYRDSVATFAYTAQTDPTISTARLTTAVSDYEEDAYLGTLVIKTQTPTGIDNPLPVGTSIAITPNPVQGERLQITARTPELLSTAFHLYTADGQFMGRHQVRLMPGVTQYSLPLPATLKPGIYQVLITNTKWKTVRSFLKL